MDAMQTMTATEFKARCLGVMDEVARTGRPVMITKRGKPVAQLVPPTSDRSGRELDALIGSVQLCGDVLAPALDIEELDAAAGVAFVDEAGQPRGYEG